MSERHTVLGYCIIEAESPEEAIEAAELDSDAIWNATKLAQPGEASAAPGSRSWLDQRQAKLALGWIVGVASFNALPDAVRVASRFLH